MLKTQNIFELWLNCSHEVEQVLTCYASNCCPAIQILATNFLEYDPSFFPPLLNCNGIQRVAVLKKSPICQNCVAALVPLCRGGGPPASVVACRRCRLSRCGRGPPTGERELSPVGACVVQGAFPLAAGCGTGSPSIHQRQ